MKEIRIGIIGFGTVGAGTAANLLANSDVIARRTGVKLVLSRIADLDITTDRGVEVPPGVLTTDAAEAIAESDIVVELVGGTTVAKKFILDAIRAGKSVVTANKALLALHGEEIFAAAEAAGVDVFYEASVAGGIPIIKALREGLVGNRIRRIYGIMNGTCNYILTRMEREGADFNTVLADAQKLGYAEANPSLDIDGFDTAHKTAILAALVIIPAMATTGAKLDQGGPGLLFIYLPNLIRSMPGGTLIAIIFFVAVLFAGMTSLLNLYEAPIATVQEKLHLGRVPACAVIGIIGAAVSLLIQGIVSDWMDVLSIYICPLGAGLAGIMFFWVFGKDYAETQVNKGREKKFSKWFVPVCRYIYIPVCVLVLILGIALGGIG